MHKVGTITQHEHHQVHSCRPSLLVLELVGESVHAVVGGEDVVEVGEDVVRDEGDELAPTPEYLAEEEERVEAVGEASDQPNHLAYGAVLLLDAEHPR